MRVNAQLVGSAPYLSRIALPHNFAQRVCTRLHRYTTALMSKCGADQTDGVFTERMAEVPEFIRRVANARPRTPILDVGCAESYMPLHYIAMGHQVHGLDLRDPGLDVPRFVYIPGDAARVKLDRQYDVITLLSTLEHCGVGDHYGGEPASDDAAVVANLRRFLSPRGRFICSVPFGKPKTMDFFRVYDEARLLSLFGRLEDARYYRFDEVTWYPCAKEDATSWEATQWVERIVVFETSPAPG